MIGGLLGTIGLFTVLFSINKDEKLQNLYVNLSQNDLSSISNFLVKNDYQDFKISDKTIKVPSQDIDRIRGSFKPRRTSTRDCWLGTI